MPPRMLSKHKRAALSANHFGPHYLVSQAIGKNSMLMNARFMSKCVAPHNCLVGLDNHPGYVRQHLARCENLFAVDSRRILQFVSTNLQRHDNLLERSVSGPLA